jgi:hypothetical protein
MHEYGDDSTYQRFVLNQILLRRLRAVAVEKGNGETSIKRLDLESSAMKSAVVLFVGRSKK